MACTPKPVRRQLKRARKAGGTVIYDRGSHVIVELCINWPSFRRSLRRTAETTRVTSASMADVGRKLAQAQLTISRHVYGPRK